MWSNKSELKSELRKAGLGEWATKLADAARQCVILLPGPTAQGAAAPVGASRLGGEPDLPPDVDWPTRPPMRRERGDRQSMPARVLFGASHWLHRFRRSPRWARASQAWEREQQAQRQRRERAWPLSFVAQIDFADLHAVHALHGFPLAGRLLLFCDGVDLPWGAADEQAHARVVFTELPPEGLQRRRQPPEFEAARDAKLRDEFAFKPRLRCGRSPGCSRHRSVRPSLSISPLNTRAPGLRRSPLDRLTSNSGPIFKSAIRRSSASAALR